MSGLDWRKAKHAGQRKLSVTAGRGRPMSEWSIAIMALIIGGLFGLIMGAGISGHITRSWITAGSFQFDCVTYKVERLEP